MMFQLTAARRRLGSSTIACTTRFGFQLTAARRRLVGNLHDAGGKTGGFNSQPPEGGWAMSKVSFAMALVSTHSRPKAAGRDKQAAIDRAEAVSTHSRPKAAGMCPQPDNSPRCSFNSQPPEGGWINTMQRTWIATWFQLTAARRRLAAGKLAHIKPTIVSTHSRPKAAG